MDWAKTMTLAVSILALAGVVVLNASGIRADIAAMRTEFTSEAAADRAEAAAERRANRVEFRAALDDFRAENRAALDEFRAAMQLVAERQSRLEGQWLIMKPLLQTPPDPTGAALEPG